MPTEATPLSAATGARRTPEVLTGSGAVLRSLEHLGITDVFGLPGGAIIPFYDELMASKTIRHILVRHEQGAGHAAEGYASSSGKVGVAIATSGPGATNLVTAIADAYMDSVPFIAITGQVFSTLMGTDAFQEADIVGITMPITKHSFLVTKPEDVPATIAAAYQIATTGRPGPVLVDITKDAQQNSAPYVWPPKVDLPGYRPVTKAHGKQITAAAQLLAAASRPVLYVGGGVIRSGASKELLAFAEATGAPVVTTLMARGAFPDSHAQHLGMPGMHGTVPAVLGLQESDLIIALGARFDDRVTGKVDDFAPGAKVVHVDIDPAEISKIRYADVPIVGDAKEVLVDLTAAWADVPLDDRASTTDWWAHLEQLRDRLPARLHRTDRRAPRPAGDHQADRRDDRTRGRLRLRRRPAPDVVGAVHPVRAPERLAQLRWRRHDGLLGPRRDGRQGGPARPGRLGDRRRRLLPDDQPGTRDLRHQRHPDQGRDHQQLVARHGAAVADAVLRRTPLVHRPAAPATAPAASRTS